MGNPHQHCPFCDTQPVASFFFKHLLNKHKEKLFDCDTADGKFNRSALNFSADRRSLPRLRINKESRYVCFHCEVAIQRDKYADKHLDCLSESVLKVKSLFGEIKSETPPSGSSEPVSNQEAIAYKSVIIKLLDEIDNLNWIVGRWNAARDIPEIYQVIEDQVPEVEVAPFDPTDEYKKEARIINLDRDHLKQFRNAKF